MTVVRFLNRVMRPPTVPWRTVLSVTLLVGYLALAGDAIRCQYSSPEHDHHGGSSPSDPAHATHCVLANHGSAAIPSIASLGAEPLEPVGSLPIVAPLLAGMLLIASASARAPPAVRRRFSI